LRKIYIFALIYIFASPILITMHFCIMLYMRTGRPDQRHQSGLKTGGSWVLKVQQTEHTIDGINLAEFLFNIHKYLYFWKVPTFGIALISNSCTL